MASTSLDRERDPNPLLVAQCPNNTTFRIIFNLHYPISIIPPLSIFVHSYIAVVQRAALAHLCERDRKVEGRALLKGGFLADAGDEAGGVIGSIISLVLLSGGLIALCTLLELIFMSKAKTALKYAVKLNDYAGILLGLGVTIVVQSLAAAQQLIDASRAPHSTLKPLPGSGQ